MTIITLTSPSGAGKTTITEKLLSTGEFVRPITSTTRSPRPGEVNGVHYHFISEDQFESNIHRGEMFEYAQVYQNYYGITKASLDLAVSSGKPVLWIVDTQGMLSVKQLLPCTSIFITPPSIDELERRLRGRNPSMSQNDEQDLNLRLSRVSNEISNIGLFDHVVVNDNLEECCALIRQIAMQSREAFSVAPP